MTICVAKFQCRTLTMLNYIGHTLVGFPVAGNDEGGTSEETIDEVESSEMRNMVFRSQLVTVKKLNALMASYDVVTRRGESCIIGYNQDWLFLSGPEMNGLR